jgi:phage shock protein PspC (stress-responsive transcriptional regulator)
VCQGLARYFALDVTLLRIIAVLLLLGTGDGMFFVYLG